MTCAASQSIALIRVSPADAVIEETLRSIVDRCVHRLNDRRDGFIKRAAKSEDQAWQKVLTTHADAIKKVSWRIEEAGMYVAISTLDSAIDMIGDLFTSLHGFTSTSDSDYDMDFAAMIIEHVVDEAEPKVKVLRTLRHISLAYPQDAIRRARKLVPQGRAA